MALPLLRAREAEHLTSLIDNAAKRMAVRAATMRSIAMELVDAASALVDSPRGFVCFRIETEKAIQGDRTYENIVSQHFMSFRIMYSEAFFEDESMHTTRELTSFPASVSPADLASWVLSTGMYAEGADGVPVQCGATGGYACVPFSVDDKVAGVVGWYGREGGYHDVISTLFSVADAVGKARTVDLNTLSRVVQLSSRPVHEREGRLLHVIAKVQADFLYGDFNR
eukprot:Opistho-2@2121